MIKIIQSSPMHTVSTLLLNLIHGFISPKEEIHLLINNLIDKFLITKTHNTNVIELENRFPQYRLFFIMSERNDNKIQATIKNEYKKKSNVLVINYDKLCETENNSINNIIDYIFDEFNKFIPKELKPDKNDSLIKADMKKRVEIVNKTVELMKDKSFSQWDTFTGIHGNHRNRTVGTNITV